ncbi:hypothetical protein Golob_025618, partial [Gossypium lobatum]|nr:hypothetical protein [Gossypium lobatum]
MVGNGRMTVFWEDIWCCSRPLKMEFPRVFRLARRKKGMVADYSSNNGVTTKSVKFSMRALGGFVRTSADLIQLNQILFVDMTPSFTRLSKFQYMRDRNEEVTGCGGVLRDMEG